MYLNVDGACRLLCEINEHILTTALNIKTKAWMESLCYTNTVLYCAIQWEEINIQTLLFLILNILPPQILMVKNKARSRYKCCKNVLMKIAHCH